MRHKAWKCEIQSLVWRSHTAAARLYLFVSVLTTLTFFRSDLEPIFGFYVEY